MNAVKKGLLPSVPGPSVSQGQRAVRADGASPTVTMAPVAFSLKEVAVIIRSLDYVQQYQLGEVERDEHHVVLTAISKLSRLSGLERPRDFEYWVSPKGLGA
ncbi:hypothetical protein KFU94_00660 [Chloroflexi bacterium TSY]|nr:hypothetical protein [Chloroflexi bacterium TSY]